jgi:hypothetical protein
MATVTDRKISAFQPLNPLNPNSFLLNDFERSRYAIEIEKIISSGIDLWPGIKSKW